MFAISRSPLSNQARRVRHVKLGLSISPVVGAYVYSRTHQMPPLICPFRFLTRIPCPGCGMSCSFLSIARGDLHQAVFYNLFGPVLFAIFLLAVIHIALELTTGHKIKTFYTQLWTHKKLKSLSFKFILIYHTG